MSLEHVTWILGDLPSEAQYYIDGEYKKIPEEVLNKKMAKGKIALLYGYKHEPYVTMDYPSGTFRTWLKAVYDGLHKKIKLKDMDKDQHMKYYALIASFRYSDDRLKLMKKFETNQLRPVDLLGDSKYYEGRLRLSKGVWVYSVGS